MEYIFPVPPWLRGKILEYKRLYAFPSIPEKRPFILDSGAFALSKSGRKMGGVYFEKLHEYYNKYPGHHVAPDVFLNPAQTMKNFKFWVKKYSDCCVWPVIQCSGKKIEWAMIQYQLDFYREFFSTIEILFFSNPSLRSGSYPKDIFQKIKNYCKVDWVHNFGAGWDVQDIEGYNRLRGLDSVDSIAYYNDLNSNDGNWMSLKGTRQQKAKANIRYVTEILS